MSIIYVIISAIILLTYLYVCLFLLKISKSFTSKRTKDYVLQDLPGWVLILIINSLVKYIYPAFLTGSLVLNLVFYTSLIICSFSVILLIVKFFDKKLYDGLVNKIQRN